MLKVGVTGGIGSGKSIVCDVFEHLGIPVFYADAEARRIMQEDPGISEHLFRHFGREIMVDGKLNKAYLAGRIFSDPGDRAFVNGLVHPEVQKAFNLWSEERKDQPYVIEEAALLFESGAHRMLDFIVWVSAPKELRIKRVMDRDGISRERVEARMQSQADPDSHTREVNFRILNDGREFVVPQVLEADREIRTKIKVKTNGEIR